MTTYHSLQDVFAAKSNALQKIHQRIQDLSSVRLDYHPSSGGWSITEILEHLSIVESGMLKVIASLLKKTEDAGRTTTGPSVFEISVQSFYERSQSEKYIARDKFLPTGKVTASDSLQLLRDVQTELFRLEPRLQSVDLTSASFPHWIFGPLNLGQWLAFVGLHEERHCAQIESILSSPFPGSL